MQSSSDHSVSGLSVLSSYSQLGHLTQQLGSMTRASQVDRKVTLGSMALYPTTKNKNNNATSAENEEDHDSGRRPRRESPTSSTASLESIDDDWEYETLHPIQEVILQQKQAPFVEHHKSSERNNNNVWMDHLAALVGTLVFCALLFASRALQK